MLRQHFSTSELILFEKIMLVKKNEMQNSGPAARPGPKFRPGRAFCGAEPRLSGAGLMPGSGEAITMYYAVGAGLRAVLERCWLGSMLNRFRAVPVWARAWLLKKFLHP